jgi:hypothetical protein
MSTLHTEKLVLEYWKMMHWFQAWTRKNIHEYGNIKLEFLDVMIFSKEKYLYTFSLCCVRETGVRTQGTRVSVVCTFAKYKTFPVWVVSFHPAFRTLIPFRIFIQNRVACHV